MATRQAHRMKSEKRSRMIPVAVSLISTRLNNEGPETATEDNYFTVKIRLDEIFAVITLKVSRHGFASK